MDGKALDLSEEAGRLWLHTGIFAVVCAVGMFSLWKWGKYLFVGLWILALGLILTAANNFRSADQSRPPPVRHVDAAELSSFSEKQNALILVLDSFQSDILDVLLENKPELNDDLSGFVFFPDTLGVAPTTYLTMPAFHSGVQYDMEVSLPDFYRRGVEEGSFMGEMGRNGHHVSVINPIASGCPNPSNICEYQEGLLEASDLANAESAWVADWSVFRAAPGVLKRKVFEDGLGTVSRLQGGKALRGLEQRIFHGNSVLERMTEFLSSESSVPTVKLIHLFNTHPPFMLDSECNFIGVKKRIYRHDQTEQTACVMKWTLELFDRMKEQGVYDNTMILLTADTGMGNFYAEDDLSSLYAQEHGIPEGEKGRSAKILFSTCRMTLSVSPILTAMMLSMAP